MQLGHLKLVIKYSIGTELLSFLKRKMGSRQMPLSGTVPILNLTEILSRTPGSSTDETNLRLNPPSMSKLVKEVRNACIQWGFFYVVGHGVAEELVDGMRNIAKEFFHKPKDFKKTVQRQPNNYRGYTDHELTKQMVDLKECFDFGVEYAEKMHELENGIDLDAGKNQWPDTMPGFRNTLLSYFSAMHSLSSSLMDLVFLSLNVDPIQMRRHFNENSDTSFCRLNYYPICENSHCRLGVGPHSDAGVLTVLLQDDDVSSLQVSKDGKFHDVPPVPGSFVVNIGDMMQVWSNGLYTAPVHRVLSNPTKERFSVPFFFNPSYDTDVEPLANCISNDKPPLYRPVNWGVFRQGRILGDYADYGEEIQIQHFEIK